MFKVVICEDCENSRELIKETLKKIQNDSKYTIRIIEFENGEELINNYPENIDIFMLDIEMGNLSGMDVAREIRKRDNNTQIIFTTGNPSYLQEGYEVRAYRYLIKPFSVYELKQHVLACINDIKIKKSKNIVVQEKNNIYKIPIDEILYIEVYKKDITIHTQNSEYQVKMSITNIEKELIQYNFFRCHRSYLVNLKKVDSLKGNVIVIKNIEIPVSRYRINEFKCRLAKSLGEILC
ncbi:LytR/AlgR family response regulator transcription factor [Romboutsia lituseburensis]|uniref:Stage 0 sporulation protein A homolog n=1 Tax=Romboutsia lituseburensis DSM 797 TaxID=1121325 RepID=A0A1G9HWW6_9FIRM|nr:LytTR family DNA-binding domain-containing protein [Romboutsia lituseburensis]CEH34145.1 VirR [Romboutsia lituseburensis]SDL17451.1 DNA-binding response regulator, LytR/AlgR family [Romboutsia lituseburensis DSM 797]